MAWKKTHNLSVKTGEYQSEGKTKGRYENVGHVLSSDDGGQMFLLKRTFNPAGVPNPKDGDSVVVYKNEIKEDGYQPKQSTHDQQKTNAYQPQPDALDDEIPFAIGWLAVLGAGALSWASDLSFLIA